MMLALVAAATIMVAAGRESVVLFESTDAAKACADAVRVEDEYGTEVKRLEGEARRLTAEKRRQLSRTEAMTDAEWNEREKTVADLERRIGEAGSAAVAFRLEQAPKRSALSVCAQSSVAALVAGVEVEALKRSEGFVQVKVLTGKHGGKVGWVLSESVKEEK